MLKIENFVKNIDNKSSIPIDDLIKIGKRYKNNKREFLFINKYLGKHLSVRGKDVIKMFDEFYGEIKKSKSLQNKKVFIVGFCETATALAQHVMYKGVKDENSSIEFVYYVQTTREEVEFLNKDYVNLAFQEEHSHATNQALYVNLNNLPDYDVVLFIEDEITTGKTILNFIETFDNINKGAQYKVASILNFQSKEHKEVYKEKKIDTISLVSGELKEEYENIVLTSKDKPEDYYTENSLNWKNSIKGSIDPRKGLNKEDFIHYIEQSYKNIVDNNSDVDIEEIIGTEEYMYIPILYSKEIDKEVRSTTRSPIVISEDDRYVINSGIQIPSVYDSNRKTFLYNVENKNRLIITDVEADNYNYIPNSKLLYSTFIKVK